MTPLPAVRVVAVLALAVCVSGGRPRAQSPAIHSQLDRYLRGEFDAVVREIAEKRDFEGLLDQLKKDGGAWTRAGGPAELPRRTLAAATLAMESVREAIRTEPWKWVQRVNLNQKWAVPPGDLAPAPRPPQSFTAADAIYWKPAPQLLEWGCRLIRTREKPDANERLWHLAAVGVAELAGDFEFLIGSPWQARGNPSDEFEHLNHVIKRFDDEPRFKLAQAIAVDFQTWMTGFRRTPWVVRNGAPAIEAFGKLKDDEAVGAEAMVRLGVLRFRSGAPGYDEALQLFDQAERATRDRYLIYLARYFRGQVHAARQQRAEAEKAYRDALATIPRAQSATMALAQILFTSDRRREASELVESSLTLPQPIDPWRAFEAADDRFWPEILPILRSAIAPGLSPAPVPR